MQFNVASPTTRRWLWIGVSAVTLIITTYIGLLSMFRSVLWYDDEGYVMITLRSILEGHALYSRVFSQYGPAHFALLTAVHRLFNLPVSHDMNRAMALGEWLALSGLGSLIVWQGTKNRLAALTSYILVFLYTAVATKEPGHPQQFVAIGCFAAIALWQARPFLFRYMLVGATLAAIVLTKINVGILLSVASLLVIFPKICQRGPWKAATLFGFTALILLLSPLAMTSRTREYTEFAAWLSAAVIAVSFAAACRDPELEATPTANILQIVAAGLSTSLILVLWVLSTGSTLEALWSSLVTRPMSYAKSLTRAFAWMPSLLPLAITSLVACGFAVKHGLQARWIVYSQALVGLGVVTLILADSIVNAGRTFVAGGTTTAYADALVLAGPLWAWLLLCVKPSSEKSKLFLLASCAALLPAMAWPVSGSQVTYGSLPAVVGAIILLFEGTLALGPRFQKYIWYGAGALCLGLCAALANAVSANEKAYFIENVPLALPGAELLRLPRDEAALRQGVVLALKQNCDRFVSLFGENSYYFWALQDPPSDFNATLWPFLLSTAEQQETVTGLSAAARPCLLARASLNLADYSNSALISYAVKNLVPAYNIGPYHLYIRPGHKR